MYHKEDILNNRYLLIRGYLFHSKGSQSEQAKRLTECAIENRFVEPRKPVSGQTPRKWSKDRNPPAWACKAACKLLIQLDYLPQESLERLVWAYYLRETSNLDQLSREQLNHISQELELSKSIII